MSNPNTPRNINLSNARGGAQPDRDINEQRRQVYDQSVDAQRAGAVQGQPRRAMPPPQPMRRADPYASQQPRSAAQQRQAAAAQQRSGATYEEYNIDRQSAQQAAQAAQAAHMAQQDALAQQQVAQQLAAQRQAMARQQAMRGAPQRPASGQMQQRRPASSGQSQYARPQQATRGTTQRPPSGLLQPQRAAGADASRRRAMDGAQAVQGRAPYRSQGVQGTVGTNGGGSGGGRGGAAAKKRKTAKTLNRIVAAMCATFAVLLVCYVGLRIYASTIINTGEGGTTAKEYRTPPQFSGSELNLLMLGIDYTAEDGQGRDPNGSTDMIMYIRFNFEDNTIRMLQIPRDTFVGANEPTGNTGKINALYGQGDDKTNRVNNIAKVLYEQYKLPVDNYVSIDMDSLRQIVDLFGGIEVYVTEPMQDPGIDGVFDPETDSYIPAGWNTLSGAASEFFLRNRHQYATSDIRRLENQRYFYSALFRLVRTSPWQEIVKLVPVVQKYINTDIDPVDCAGLGIKMLKIPSSQIMICRMPVRGSAERYNNLSVVVCAVPETAELLNQYFRPLAVPVAAEEMPAAQLPVTEGLHEANVQWMSDIDADGGGTVGEAAGATQTGDDVLGIANSESASVAASTAPAA